MNLIHTRNKFFFICSIFSVFVLMIPFLTGCGKQFNDEAVDETSAFMDDDLIIVGVSQIGSESVWRTANSNSIQDSFTKENGYFLIFNNARQKQENQIKAIRGFISQQVDYIVFSPIMEDGWDTVLQEAKDANIPVVLMDRQVKIEDDSLYTAWVGSNFEEEGQKAGEWLSDYLQEQNKEDEDINILVLQGTKGATSMIGRTNGFNAIAAHHMKWKILEQVDAEYTTAKGKEEMENMLAKYPDIDVVVSQNDDMTFGVLEALKNAGKTTGVNGDVTIISFDATKKALEKVKSGEINVDIECNPEQGPYIEKIIHSLENNEKVDKYYYVPEKVFTQQNVDQYLDSRRY